MTPASAAFFHRISRPVTLAVLACGLAATLALNLPGHLSYDSVMQLLDGRTGRYHTWHPPFVAWLLGLGDHLWPGSALYVCGQATLVFAALAVIVARAQRTPAWAPLAALALIATPHLVLWQGVVWKDVLFADLMVAGFVALAQALRRSPLRGVNWPLAALGLSLLGAAALVRQNGVIAPLAGATAVGWALWRRNRTQPARATAIASACLLVTLAGVVLATVALDLRSVDGSGAQAQFRSLEVYDVAGVVARRPDLPLDRLPAAMGANLRSAALARYTPVRIDTLQGLPAFDGWTRGRPPPIDAQWRDVVLHQPDLWLRQRLSVFGWMIAPPDLARCTPDFTGIDGDKAMLATLRIKPGWRPQDLAMARYAAAFHVTPLYSHWVFALAAAALAILFLRSDRSEDVAYGAMLLAALGFAGSFLLIGVACDYRYLYALDLAVLVSGFRAAIDPPRRGGAVA